MTPRRSSRSLGVSVCTTMPCSARAGRRIAPASVDLHQAQAARAEGLQAVGGAELGDIDAGLGGRAHQRAAFGHGDFLAIYGQGDGLGGLAGGRAQVAVSLDDGFQHGGLRAGGVRPRWRRGGTGGEAEVLRKVVQGGQHGVRRHAAQRAQRAAQHGVAQVAQQMHLLFARRAAGHDLVEGLHAARRADAAGRALAAGLDCAEFHGVAGHARHVDGVVEGHQAAVADHGRDPRIGLVIQRHVPLRFGQVGAQRSANLHRAQRGRGAAAAEAVQQVAQRQAEAFSTSPPCLRLPASWKGRVPCERPTP